MARKVLVFGSRPTSNLWAYSKPLTIRKPTPASRVSPM
jgi:hypothetical protein